MEAQGDNERSETFEEAMKAVHVKLDPETAFTPPAEIALREKHTHKLRHAIQHMLKDVTNRIKVVDKKGLPLRYPGRDDYLKKVPSQLSRLYEKLKQQAVYHCLSNGSTGTPSTSTGPGNFCFHLLVRQPDILKDFFYDTFLLVRALDRYQKLDGVTDEVFRSVEIIIGLAERLRKHSTKVDLEFEQQKLSFCEYQVAYAAKSNVSIVPNSGQTINIALRQARIADPDMTPDDLFKMLRGYVFEGVLQKRKGGHAVVDVIQRLEEDLATRHGVKIRIVV